MNSKPHYLLALAAGGLCLAACAERLPGETTPTLQVRVVQVLPHDQAAFSQGLAIEGNTLFEGTGQYGKSTLRQIELESGKVTTVQNLTDKYFGEGITLLGDRIYQLTWKAGICIVYDKSSLKPLGYLKYTGQGWGLADDEQKLYLSDGTSTIRVLDPSTFRVERRLRVKDGRRFVKNLNELEFVEGYLLANIWYEDRIAKIDPQTGEVVAWIDCSGVYPANTRPDREHVLNGIAYDQESRRLYVTGKNWPSLYEIEIVDPNQTPP